MVARRITKGFALQQHCCECLEFIEITTRESGSWSLSVPPCDVASFCSLLLPQCNIHFFLPAVVCSGAIQNQNGNAMNSSADAKNPICFGAKVLQVALKGQRPKRATVAALAVTL